MSSLSYPKHVILSTAKTVYEVSMSELDQLSTIGITEKYLEKFSKFIKKAEDVDCLEMDRQELKTLTQNKNNVLEECLSWCRGLKIRMEIALGANSVALQTLPKKLFLKAANSESAMISYMNVLLQTAENHIEKLSELNQIPDFIHLGQSLLEKLVKMDASQEYEKINNKSLTKERLRIYKKLYDYVNTINKAGRYIFNGDPTKKVLFNSRWPKRKKGASLKNTNDITIDTGEQALKLSA